MEALRYWISRLTPLIENQTEREVLVVFVNRSGAEHELNYAGTSAVLGIRDGEVNVYGILGRGDQELLIVDTASPPFGQLVYRPDGQEYPTDNENLFLPTSIENKNATTVPRPPRQIPRHGMLDGPVMQDSSSTSLQREPQERSRETQTSSGAGPEVTPSTINAYVPTLAGPTPTPIPRRSRMSLPPVKPRTQQYVSSYTPAEILYTTPSQTAAMARSRHHRSSLPDHGLWFSRSRRFSENDVGVTSFGYGATNSSIEFPSTTTLEGRDNLDQRYLYDAPRGSNTASRLSLSKADEEGYVEALPQTRTLEQLAVEYTRLLSMGGKTDHSFPVTDSAQFSSSHEESFNLANRTGQVNVNPPSRRHNSHRLSLFDSKLNSLQSPSQKANQSKNDSLFSRDHRRSTSMETPASRLESSISRAGPPVDVSAFHMSEEYPLLHSSRPRSRSESVEQRNRIGTRTAAYRDVSAWIRHRKSTSQLSPLQTGLGISQAHEELETPFVAISANHLAELSEPLTGRHSDREIRGRPRSPDKTSLPKSRDQPRQRTIKKGGSSSKGVDIEAWINTQSITPPPATKAHASTPRQGATTSLSKEPRTPTAMLIPSDMAEGDSHS